MAALFVAGCGGDSTDPNPLIAGTGGHAPQADASTDASEPDTGGSDAAADAAPNTSRGDPAKFPATCLATCTEACAKLDTCGGATSAFPLTKDQCEARCALATSGPVWDDISSNFRCCASQPACFDVSSCGGWLADTDPLNSCTKLCSCFMGGSTAPTAPAGLDAPPGYRWAPDVAVVQGGAAPTTAAPGVEVIFSGSRSGLRFKRPVTADQVRALTGGAQLIPTFYDQEGRIAAATGGIVIVLPTPAAVALATQRASTLNLPKPEKLGYGRSLYYIASTDPWMALAALPSLASVPGATAELDMLRSYVKRYVPNDALFPKQWHLRNEGFTGAIAGVDGRVAEAWDITQGSPEVIIGINDDGVDVNHVDLKDNVAKYLDFPADWESKLGISFGSHGTSCAGVAGAVDDNLQGGSGVCPKCKLMPHLLGETTGLSFNVTDKQIADGFKLLVDEGAWIISNSWGPGGGDPRFKINVLGGNGGAVPQVIQDAFAYAETTGRGGKGTVILFAAGNDNNPTDAYTQYPTNLGIAAVDDQGLKSYYSNFGPAIAIAAPSNGGVNGITTTAAKSEFTFEFGGTSSACPFAAGVAGLILSANPTLTAAEVRTVIKASASKIDPVWGKWDTQGHSPYYGDGLVNAYVAVKMAKGDCTDPATCQAPSDACTTNCEKTACGPCRTSAECAPDYVCQAVQPLGRSVCVAKDTGAGCPADTEAVGGYCIPTRKACNLCGESEQCNWRDDDCNGTTDDNAVCGYTSPDCPFLSRGCDADSRCAGLRCAEACTTKADCSDTSALCAPVKDRYGTFSVTAGGCYVDENAKGCEAACQVLTSSLPDADLAAFITCMNDGNVACGAVMACAGKLPIKM